MSKGLYVAIAILATIASALVFVSVSGANSAESSIKRQGPPAQAKARKEKLRNFDAQIVANANDFISEGRETFRFDTFGDEQLWTGVLRMHEVIATVSPRTALSVGLKVDVDALPASVVDALRNGLI